MIPPTPPDRAAASWPPADLEERLRAFLAEDLGSGDVTADAVVPADATASARLVAKGAGVVCGADLVERVVRLLDPAAIAEELLADGTGVRPGSVVAVVRGRARALLAAERTLLNLVQRMSGVATLTRRFVEAVAGTGAAIFDTRKTAPGLRAFDKRAVVAGGGVNLRVGLWDQVLIKSNHLIFGAVPRTGAPRKGAPHPGAPRPIEAAIAAARAAPASRALQLEIEVFDVDEALRAAAAGADLVLLDNFEPARVREAVATVRARHSREQVGLEASGGITLENVRAFAEAGVDRISVGALTHSAAALDLSLAFARAPA
jgi:nicotinate-nucleotide pyrophosphorylase (carboxylating)